MLMREAAKVNDWTLNNAGIAAMWRGGCIIKVCDWLIRELDVVEYSVERLPLGHYSCLPREP